jgi:antitoxin ParD1/3/4/toxin ParE1/3/4
MAAQALADLDEIWWYVFEDRADSVTADKVIDGIYAQACKLAEMPGMGHKREDLADEALRFWPVYDYLIIYRPETDPIEIARVLHSARDIQRILSEAN